MNREPALKTEILDTTLREGEQCYGVFFPKEVKKRIASLLDEIGVDFIEVGHPAAAPSIREAVSEIAGLHLQSRLIGHARLDQAEIRLVKELGLSWVGLFSGISDRSLKRYGLTRQELYKKAGNAVLYAKEQGLHIKFTCEDASRTGINDVVHFYEYLQSLGVDRLSYADTLGIMAPRNVRSIRTALDGTVPFSKLHFHFHDDFSRAYANAVTAMICGARCIDTSIMGIGERAGLAPLGKILTFIKSRNMQENRACRFHLEKLAEAEKLVSGSINYDRFTRRRFAHKSGIHINGIFKDPANYEPDDLRTNCGRRLVVLSKMIGRSGLRMIFARNGFSIRNIELSEILEQVKADEFVELADDREIMIYLHKKRRALSAGSCR